MFIETPHEKGQPAAVAFKKRDAQFGMAVQHPAAAETADGEHLFDRMGKSMAQHEVVTELFAHLPGCRIVCLVKAQRHLEILERRPERLVIGVMPVVAVDDIGA